MRNLIALLVTLTATVAVAADGTPPTEPGHVISLVGEKAWVQRGSNRTPMKTGSEFHGGDVLVTGPATIAKLLLGPGEVAMLLKPDSEVRVEKTADHYFVVNVKSGSLLSTVREPGKTTTHFFVRTRSATMGVRGTTLFVRETPGQPTLFCPCHGKISVTGVSGQGKVDFDSKHHDAPKLISVGGAPLAERMKPIPADADVGHSDAEIEDLKTLVARPVPFR